MEPRIEPLEDGAGFEVVDPIQRRRFRVETDRPVDPDPVEPEGFFFPVTAAATVTVERLELSQMFTLTVRTLAGEMVAEVTHYDTRKFPPDEYLVELNGPVKVLVRLDGGLTATTGADGAAIEFDAPTEVRVGARSYHERPSATVTTTADPEDLMAAVSTLGSALKDTGVERSWPTLRGYPPEFELGDALAVPDGIELPETGVAIEVPPELGPIYAVSPLAYYLGATVRPGDVPRVVGEGFEHRLDRRGEVVDGVARVLKQTLTLDCAVRTEGYYDIDLQQRAALEDRLDLDWAALYDASLSEQLERYLSVPYDRIADVVPRWRLAVDARVDPGVAPFVPHLAYDLALVRPRDPTPREATEAEQALDDELADFFRGPVAADGGVSADGPYVTPAESDAIERAWAGRGIPFGAGKLLLSGYRNRLDWASDGTTSVTVVCNDPEMSAEHDDGPLYGAHDEVPFDVTAHRELSVDALGDVLRRETDFLHYIGHAEDGALVCTDGDLDLSEVESVGAGAFLLNGCRSYDLGIEMVEAGSVGGIVTLSEVGNTGAIRIGRLVARLVNVGFPLRTALALARERQVVGHQYVVVGDGGVDLVQSESFSPVLSSVEDAGDGQYHLEVACYPTAEVRVGSVFIPLLRSNEQYRLVGDAMEFEVSEAVLREWFRVGHEDEPVIYEDELYWGDTVPFDD